MLRGIAYYIALTIGVGPATAQEWAHTWGGSQGDSISSVAADAAGNVYFAGATSSFGAGGSDILLLKYDMTGHLLWSRTWGGSADEGANAVAIDASGNIYVAGSTTSFGAGWADAVLLRFDSSGNLIWSETWGGPSFDVAYDIAFDAIGNIYVAAESYSSGNSAVLLKFDSNGDLLSERFWKGPATYDSAYSVDVDKNGNVVLAGVSWDYSVSPNHNSILVLKFDNQGNLLWNKNLVSGAEDEAHGAKIVRFDGNGNVFIAGHRASVCQSTNFSTCNFDVEIVKLDPNGSLIWAQSWGGNGFESAGGLAFDQSGNLVVTGTTTSFLSGTSAAMLLELDATGRFLQSQVWGGKGSAGASGVAVDNTGVIVFGGFAPNASGGWEDVTGSVTTASPSLTSPAGSSGAATIGLGTPGGVTASPTGALDTGGGGMDTLAIRTTLAPQVSVGSVVSAASYVTTVAPGSIAASFGTFLLSSPAEPQATPLPSSLSGLSMQFGSGAVAPLFYVSGSQVNLQVPWELAGQSQVPVTVTVNGQTSAPQTVNIAPFSPGIFTINAQGTGQGAILDASYHMVDASNAAIPGSTVLQIFCTGLGAVTNQPQTGFPAPSSNPLAETTTIPTVTIGGVPANVLFSGLAPGFVGEYQVNALVPATTLAGSAVPVAISIGGVTSNTVTIAVQGPTGTGTLDIQVTDLPAGTPANVSVTSANGYATTITASASLQVPSGTYSITASPVVAVNASYNAATQTVNVAPGATVNAQVAYDTVVPNTTKTLDQQGMQGVTVSTDGNTLTLPSASAAAQALKPGDVLAVGITTATPGGLLRKITSVSQSGSQIVAVTTQATLADAFQQLDFKSNAAFSLQDPPAGQALPPGVTFHRGKRPAGLARSAQSHAQVPCSEDTASWVQALAVPIIAGGSGSITASGELDICTSLEVDFHITALPPTLKSLLVVATISGDLHVGVSGEYQGSVDMQTPIMPALQSDPIEVDVAGVPVVLTAQVTFFVGTSGTVNGSFSAGADNEASLTLGLSYSGGQFSPVDTWSSNFTEDPLVLDAGLTAKVYAGAKIDVKVDEVVTPSISPDAFLQLSADTSANPWWTLSGGVEISACSIALDIFGIGGQLDCPDALIQQLQLSVPIGQAPGGFLPSDITPAITNIAPSSVAAGSSGVTIAATGTNFAPGATVNFNGAALLTTFVSTSQITAMLPTGDLKMGGTFPITVANPGPNGGTSPPFSFKVQAANNPQPTIVSLSPSSASAGSGPLTLTINGSGFIASTTVTFNGVSHVATFVNSGQLTITLTASDVAAPGSFDVVVSNPPPGGGTSSAVTFAVQTAGNGAVTMLSVTGDCDSQGNLSYYDSFGVEWTQTSSYYNVNIDIAVTTGFLSVPSDGTPVQAFVTTDFLSGATSSSQVAYTTFVIPPGSPPNTLVRVFTGLALGPSAYELTIYAPTQGSAGGWCTAHFNPPTTSSAPDVTEDFTYDLNGYSTYPPAGEFLEYWDAAEFSITGMPGTPPAGTAAIQSLTLSSASVTGGSSITGTVTLTGPAPSGGAQITIQDSPAILQVASSVTVPAGQTAATFTIGAPAVASSTTVTITAGLAGSTSVSASMVISPATATSPFQNSGFDIYGTLNISGQSVPVEVQTMPLSDTTLGVISNSGGSLTIEIEMLFDEQYTVSGNTLTYSGADPASSFLNLSTLALYTSFTSATLSLTVAEPTAGAAVTGTLQFTSSGTTLSGTISATISTVSGP